MSARIVTRLLLAVAVLLGGSAHAQTKINLGTQAVGGSSLGTALIVSNGTSPLTAYAGAGCTNQFPRSLSASGTPSCSSVSLTSDITGTLQAAQWPTFTSNAFLTGAGAGVLPNAVAITGLVVGNGASAPSAYAGASCTNKALTAIGVSGTGTCSNVTLTNNSGTTLTIAANKTLTANNSITLAGTDGVVLTTPATSFTAARTDAANTFTGIQTFNTAIATGSGGTGVTGTAVGNGASVVLGTAVATYSPTLTFGGGSTGITYTTQTGRYFKVGPLIHFEANITLSSKGSSTGQASVTLPVAVSGSAARPVFSAYADSMAAGVTTSFESIAIASASGMLFYSYAAGVSSNLSDTAFTNTSTLYISGWYEY